MSGESGQIDTYYPYIENISNFVKVLVPCAKQLLHEVWAYEWDSTHSAFANYKNEQGIMREAIEKASNIVAKRLNIDRIPSGELIAKLREMREFDGKMGKITRDGFHMDKTYGRLAIGLLWFEIICKKDSSQNTFVPNSDIKVDMNL